LNAAWAVEKRVRSPRRAVEKSMGREDGCLREKKEAHEGSA